MQIKKILVPVDFSENSDMALSYATQFAATIKASLTLYHSIVMFQYDFNDKNRLEQYEEMLVDHSKSVKQNMKASSNGISSQGLEVHTAVDRGVSAADCILKYLDDHNFDLIIMGTHGKTGLKHLMQGSVAEKIVRLSPIPVLTVHDRYEDFSLNQVLIPIDFSESSHRSLRYTLEMQKIYNFNITCLHVVEKQVFPSYYAAGSNTMFDVDNELKERVLDNLRSMIEKSGGSDRIDIAVEEGMAYQAIVDYARKHKMDLIAISTRGLTGIEHVLMGSTTEKVVRLASVPVITFKE